MNLVNMAKDTKKRLFEVFERVTGVKVHEYSKAPKAPKGIGDFNAIDWQTLFNELMINTKLLRVNKSDDGENIASTVDDFTDSDGMLSPEELKKLEDFDLIEIGTVPSLKNAVFPIISSNRKYLNFNAFKIKAAEIWNKELPVQQGNNDSEVQYLRGREPES